MILIVVCSWACVLIFAWMVESKYHWTRPPYKHFALFAAAGGIATVPALLTNLFLSRETAFWVYSEDKLHSFMGFFLGAGVGEEFWKISAGICLVLYLLRKQQSLRRIDYVLGFVTIGLTFGMIENLFSYSHLETMILVTRGLISIPLHAAMGMIHGLAVARSIEYGRVSPVFLGYSAAVVIHTLCDTWSIFLSPELARSALALTAMLFIGLGSSYWRRTPEVEDLDVYSV